MQSCTTSLEQAWPWPHGWADCVRAIQTHYMLWEHAARGRGTTISSTRWIPHELTYSKFPTSVGHCLSPSPFLPLCFAFSPGYVPSDLVEQKPRNQGVNPAPAGPSRSTVALSFHVALGILPVLFWPADPLRLFWPTDLPSIVPARNRVTPHSMSATS